MGIYYAHICEKYHNGMINASMLYRQINKMRL